MFGAPHRSCPESFHWNATDYAANSSAQFQWGSELIASLGLEEHEAVLDMGCGDGKLTALIAWQVQAGVVTGIDASDEMVFLAQQTWGHIKNLDFSPMDAQNLTFHGGFDVVYSNAVLHWVADHPAVLAGVWRALKPGGRMLLQMPAKRNCEQFIEAVDSVRSAPRWRPFFRTFSFPWQFSTEHDYAHWLSDAGLKTQTITTVSKDMCHKSPRQLAGWMRTTWLPYLQCVPDAERDHFVNAVVDKYLCAVPPDEQGRTHVDVVRLEVAAIKS